MSREIEFVPDPEAPGRFVVALASLLQGLRMISVADEAAWELTNKVAFDSMPVARRQVVELLANADERIDTTAVATQLGMPPTMARRTLEDLAAHHLLDRGSHGQGKAHTWQLTAEKRFQYEKLTVPAKSHTTSTKGKRNVEGEFAGKVIDAKPDLGTATLDELRSAYLTSPNGRCARHPDEPKPWCLECKQAAA